MSTLRHPDADQQRFIGGRVLHDLSRTVAACNRLVQRWQLRSGNGLDAATVKQLRLTAALLWSFKERGTHQLADPARLEAYWRQLGKALSDAASVLRQPDTDPQQASLKLAQLQAVLSTVHGELLVWRAELMRSSAPVGWW